MQDVAITRAQREEKKYILPKSLTVQRIYELYRKQKREEEEEAKDKVGRIVQSGKRNINEYVLFARIAKFFTLQTHEK